MCVCVCVCVCVCGHGCVNFDKNDGDIDGQFIHMWTWSGSANQKGALGRLSQNEAQVVSIWAPCGDEVRQNGSLAGATRPKGMVK